MPVVRLRAGTRGSLIAPAGARTLSATHRRLHDAARLVVAPDPAVGRGCVPRELRSAHVHGLAQKRLPQGAERRSRDGHAPSARHPARRLHDAPAGEHRADAVARVRRKIQEGPGHDVHGHAGWLDGHGEEPHPMVPLLGGGGDLRRGRRGKRVAPGRELPRRFPLRGPHRVRRVYARPVADVDLVPSLLDLHDHSHAGRADLRAPHGWCLRMAVAPLIVFPDPDSLGPAHLKVAGLELWDTIADHRKLRITGRGTGWSSRRAALPRERTSGPRARCCGCRTWCAGPTRWTSCIGGGPRAWQPSPPTSPISPRSSARPTEASCSWWSTSRPIP